MRAANLTLTYDPEGRISKIPIGSTQTTFLYDGAQLIGEYDSSSALMRRYVREEGVDDALAWLEDAGVADVRYFYDNYQGSVIVCASAAGTRQTRAAARWPSAKATATPRSRQAHGRVRDRTPPLQEMH